MDRRKEATKKSLAPQQTESNVSCSAEELELLLDHAVADYKYLTTDLKTFQHGCIRNYLWLSIILLAFSAILFLNLLEQNNPVPFLHGAPSLGFYSFAIMTHFNQLSVLVIGINSMQSRENILLPISNFNLKLEQLQSEREKDYESGLLNILDDYQQSIAFETNKRMKVKATINDMSRLLIISVCLTVVSVGIYAMTPADSNSLMLRQKKVRTMPNEYKPTPLEIGYTPPQV